MADDLVARLRWGPARDDLELARDAMDDAAYRIESLQSRERYIADMEDTLDKVADALGVKRQADTLIVTAQVLQSRERRLREALLTYGEHDELCAAMVQDSCSCGLSAALKEAESE